MTERNGRPGYTCNFRSDFWCGFCLMHVNERAQHLYTIIGHLLAPVVNISDQLGYVFACFSIFNYRSFFNYRLFDICSSPAVKLVSREKHAYL